MKQETYDKARELQLLIYNLKENKDILCNKINFSRHTNTDAYHALTVKIEKEIRSAIVEILDEYITEYQSQFELL